MTKHPSLQSVATAGCVVEFLQGNEPHVAWVEEQSGDKLRLYTLNKRETKLPASRLLPWIGPRYDGPHTREAILERLREHAGRREELSKGIDALDIWEMAQGEVTVSSGGWFAGLAFETPDVDQVAAMGRALLSAKTHFKFQPPNFEVYAAEVVERRLAEQAAARERELVVTAGQHFLHELWAGWASGNRKDVARLEAQLDPTAAHKLKAMLMALMADQESQEWVPLWQALRKGLPEHAHQPLVLAMEWGIVPPHYNFLLDQAGYSQGDAWSAEHAVEIEALLAELAARSGEPTAMPEPGRFVSIDSPTTRDVDDAFAIEPLPGGGARVCMALARPTLSWDFDSPLGRAVWDRATSVYLPEGDSHMMPERLSCDAYSLTAGQDRPALFLDWELTGEARTTRFDLRLGWARVAANLHYSGVEEAFAQGTAEPDLVRGLELARLLRDNRVAAGAVVIERPEPKLCLSGPPEDLRVTMTPSEEHPRAQLLVSELMILANASVALWAKEHQVPLLHRVQDIAIPQGFSGVWSTPVDMHRVVKQLSGAQLDVRPVRHASLAAEAYSPITSPLRRLTDFINMAQVQSFLTTGAPFWSLDALKAKLPGIAARLDQVGQVQRYRPRYWKLVLMQQQCREREFDAVLVEECGGFAMLSIPEVQIYVRAGREQLGGKLFLGQRFSLRLGKVDPLANEFRVMGATEEDEAPEVEEWPVTQE